VPRHQAHVLMMPRTGEYISADRPFTASLARTILLTAGRGFQDLERTRTRRYNARASLISS